MKVFISWSGELSRELGEAFRDWLPSVIQNVKPFFTPNDIEKGARWNKDIAKELEDSSVGIFCLTPENLEKPWLLFEAGALSKNIDTSHVCPILFGVDTIDIKGPLEQFQSSPFNETEIKKLLKTINSSLEKNKLDDSVLNEVFKMWWPKLNEKVDAIHEKHKGKESQLQRRPDRDILEEILKLSRLSVSSYRGLSKNPFDTEAFRQLILTIKTAVDSISAGQPSDTALTILSATRFPLRELVYQMNLPKKATNDLMNQLAFLHYYSSKDYDDTHKQEEKEDDWTND